ncbi:hypothetical protein IWQ56_005475, partial [Coemansia nantahalensis]
AFVSCAASASYLPSLVLSRLYAALHAEGGHRALLYIDLNNFPRPSRAPANGHPPPVPPVLWNVLGGLLNGLKRAVQPPDAVRFDEHTYASSRDLCLTSIKATTAQLQQYAPLAAGPRQAECERVFWAIRRLNADKAKLPRVAKLLDDEGVLKFLLVSQALCAGLFPGNAARTTQMAAMLWDHAARVASDAGMDTGIASGSTDARPVWQLVIDTRRLYYRLIGHVGDAAPESLDALQQSLADDANQADDAARIFHDQIRSSVGVWTNIALVELLRGSLGAYNSAPVVATALLWLRCGLSHLAAASAHSRAQLWALVFRLESAQRSLTKEEIVEMDRDLVQPEDVDPIQVTPRCYALVNFVMRAVLQATPSDETLTAVADYLSTVARSNRELAVR